MKHTLGYSLILVLLFFTNLTIKSQNEFSKWYFGQQAGLDFSTSPPTLLTNGVINTNGGVATICDSNGNLLMYGDGVGVINSSHSLMANGNGLGGNSATAQSAIIVKQPGNTNIYYIFTVGANASYSIVDMNLAAGLGSVTVKSALLYSSTTQKQVAVRHCNGKDVWIINHEINSNKFRAYLLTNSGLNTSPVVTAIGEPITGTGYATVGLLKISPDGKKLASSTTSSSAQSSLGLGGYHLFDFDASSVVLSNSLTLQNSQYGAYGIEFSPDGSKLYGVSSGTQQTNPTSSIYQWNICAATPSAIINSLYTFTNSIFLSSAQWAVDGKIYIASSGNKSLTVINNPNSNGAAMGFSLNGVSLAGKISSNGLPNYINTYTRPIPAAFSLTFACQTASFTVPTAGTFSSGCSSVPYNYSGYLWDFGEPGSGAANSSTLTNPVHTYSTVGSYTASLILYSNCTNDTVKKVINITAASPALTVLGPLAICKGETRTYTASGGTSYQWSSSTATVATVPLSPAAGTSYTVSALSGVCKTTQTFSVAVNPCIGLNAEGSMPVPAIYPNPVLNSLMVESVQMCKIQLIDFSGRIIFETKVQAGKTEINTTDISTGVYTIRSTSDSGMWQGKVVKAGE